MYNPILESKAQGTQREAMIILRMRERIRKLAVILYLEMSWKLYLEISPAWMHKQDLVKDTKRYASVEGGNLMEH